MVIIQGHPTWPYKGTPHGHTRAPYMAIQGHTTRPCKGTPHGYTRAPHTAIQGHTTWLYKATPHGRTRARHTGTPTWPYKDTPYSHSHTRAPNMAVQATTHGCTRTPQTAAVLEKVTCQLVNDSYNLLWLVQTQTYLTGGEYCLTFFMQTKPV